MDDAVSGSDELTFLASMVEKLLRVGRVYFAERITFDALRYKVISRIRPVPDTANGGTALIIDAAPTYNTQVPDIIGVNALEASQLELIDVTCTNGETMWVLCAPSYVEDLPSRCPSPP